MERGNRRSTYGADASSPRVELPSGFGRMINPERVTVTSRQISKRSVVRARARLRRMAIFHVTSGSTGPFSWRGYETLFGEEVQGERNRVGEEKRRQRRKQRAFARELISIGLPWILSALTSRRCIPLRRLRVATCKVTTLSSYNELPANEQLSLNAK